MRIRSHFDPDYSSGATLRALGAALVLVTCGCSGGASHRPSVPGVPGTPTAIGGNASAMITWPAPENDGGSPITGYVITSDPGAKTASTTGARSAMVTGLTRGTSYTFTVVAQNAVGAGPASAPSNAVTPPVTVPGAPGAPTANADNASATVSWTAPADDGGSAIVDYVVTSIPGNKTVVTVGSLTATVSGLNSGTSYTFTVVARNAIGAGPSSVPSNQVTPPATVPGAPGIPTATAGNTSATVVWAEPLSDGGSPITGYVVSSNPGNKTASTTGALTAAVTGLTNGTSYTFMVVAKNAIGTGGPSAPSNAVTPAAPTLTVALDGSGTVVSSPAGIHCPGNCSASLSGIVTLTAKPEIGSYFQGWTGGCTGSARFCTVTLSEPQSVKGTFAKQMFNIAFVSSGSYRSDLLATAGGPTYTDQCNQLATAAGINNAEGNAFVALMSTASASAKSLLGDARGFARANGSPFADDLSSLFASGKMFNAVELDENGVQVGEAVVWTGTRNDGTSSSYNCNSWTSASSAFQFNWGGAGYGPGGWMNQGGSACAPSLSARVYCFGKTRKAPLVPEPAAGKRIWVSGNFTPGGGKEAATTLCNATRPPGAGLAVALLGTVSPASAPGAGLKPGTLYVRPDGIPVGTGAEIVAATGRLRSGIWQDASGAYLDAGPWTGGLMASVPTDLAMTCDDWVSTSSKGVFGLTDVVGTRGFSINTANCSYARPVYCAEQ